MCVDLNKMFCESKKQFKEEKCKRYVLHASAYEDDVDYKPRRTRSAGKLLEQQEFGIRRYPTRNITKPNYYESDISDSEGPRKNRLRKRSRSVAAASKTEKFDSKSNCGTPRKKITRRRYSEGIALTLQREENLYDDSEVYLPNKIGVKKKADNISTKNEEYNSEDICPMCKRPKIDFPMDENEQEKKIYHRGKCSKNVFMVERDRQDNAKKEVTKSRSRSKSKDTPSVVKERQQSEQVKIENSKGNTSQWNAKKKNTNKDPLSKNFSQVRTIELAANSEHEVLCGEKSGESIKEFIDVEPKKISRKRQSMCGESHIKKEVNAKETVNEKNTEFEKLEPVEKISKSNITSKNKLEDKDNSKKTSDSESKKSSKHLDKCGSHTAISDHLSSFRTTPTTDVSYLKKPLNLEKPTSPESDTPKANREFQKQLGENPEHEILSGDKGGENIKEFKDAEPKKISRKRKSMCKEDEKNSQKNRNEKNTECEKVLLIEKISKSNITSKNKLEDKGLHGLHTAISEHSNSSRAKTPTTDVLYLEKPPNVENATTPESDTPKANGVFQKQLIANSEHEVLCGDKRGENIKEFKEAKPKKVSRKRQSACGTSRTKEDEYSQKAVNPKNTECKEQLKVKISKYNIPKSKLEKNVLQLKDKNNSEKMPNSESKKSSKQHNNCESHTVNSGHRSSSQTTTTAASESDTLKVNREFQKSYYEKDREQTKKVQSENEEKKKKEKSDQRLSSSESKMNSHKSDKARTKEKESVEKLGIKKAEPTKHETYHDKKREKSREKFVSPDSGQIAQKTKSDSESLSTNKKERAKKNIYSETTEYSKSKKREKSSKRIATSSATKKVVENKPKCDTKEKSTERLPSRKDNSKRETPYVRKKKETVEKSPQYEVLQKSRGRVSTSSDEKKICQSKSKSDMNIKETKKAEKTSSVQIKKSIEAGLIVDEKEKNKKYTTTSEFRTITSRRHSENCIDTNRGEKDNDIFGGLESKSSYKRKSDSDILCSKEKKSPKNVEISDSKKYFKADVSCRIENEVIIMAHGEKTTKKQIATSPHRRSPENVTPSVKQNIYPANIKDPRIRKYLENKKEEMTSILEPKKIANTKGSRSNVSQAGEKEVTVTPREIIKRRRSEGALVELNNKQKYDDHIRKHSPKQIEKKNQAENVLNNQEQLVLSKGNYEKSKTLTHVASKNSSQTEQFQRVRQRRHSESSVLVNRRKCNDSLHNDTSRSLRNQTKHISNASRENLHTLRRTKSNISINSSDTEEFHNYSPEKILEKMFMDEKERELSRKELLKILAASSEESGIDSDSASSHSEQTSSKNSPKPCSSSKINASASVSGKRNRSSIRTTRSSARELNEKRSSSATERQIEESSDNEQSENMTKMEHYKKRLIHQHEKPTLVTSPHPTVEEDENPSPSSASSTSSMQSNQSSQQEKKKDDVVHSKVTRKRSVCRSKFRHQNLELFKLGSSIPTSLCKTKEPYNVCAEKNLQMCCQNQQNGKKEENSVSITEAIINSMEGNKKKDALLWRSMSLNNENRNETQKSPNINNNNVAENNKNLGNGRHVLPAIIPEIPERRKSKVTLPSNSEEECKTNTEEVEKTNGLVESELVIQKAAPVSISKRKSITKRRKTVIGIENSETKEQRNEEIGRNTKETNKQENDKLSPLRRRNSVSTEFEAYQNSPINLSLKNSKEESATTQISQGNLYKDPRLNSKNKNQYLKPSGQKQLNGTPRTPSSVTSQSEEPVRNYNLRSNTPNNVQNTYYQNNYMGMNFPEIQQQMMRMENPNEPKNMPNMTTPRKEPYYQKSSLTSMMGNNEAIIKTIIQVVKSSMNHNFSIEILLVLNKWYIELKDYLIQPAVSQEIKLSITGTLNEVIFYISDKLFGSPCPMKLKNYVEEMMQISLGQHKELLTNSLPLLNRNCNNEQWLSDFIKLLSATSALLEPQTLTNRTNGSNDHLMRMPTPIVNNLQPPLSHMYANHMPQNNFVSPHSPNFFMPPKDYFMTHPQNFPPPPPYGAFHYVNNTITNASPRRYSQHNFNMNQQPRHNYNMNQQHHRNEMVGTQGKHVENVLESQRDKQQLHVFPKSPQNLSRPEGSKAGPSKLRPEKLYHADNRCVPPKYGLSPSQSNSAQHNAKDRLDIIPIKPPSTSVSRTVPNTASSIVLEQLSVEKISKENSNHTDTNNQSKATMQVVVDNVTKTTDIESNRILSRQNSDAGSSTTGSINSTEQFAVPDVEELLQTNVIFNKSRTANLVQNNAVPNRVNPNEDENSINTIVKNCSAQELANSNNAENVSKIISNTVIVKDNSMEITRGNSNENSSREESAVATNASGNLNDIIVERIEYRITDQKPATSISTDVTIAEESVEILQSDKLKIEDYNLYNMIKQKLSLGNSTEERAQILKDVLRENFEDDYKNFIALLTKPEKKEIGFNENEVITIDTDEELLIDKEAEMPKPKVLPPKLIKLDDLKRKENDEDKEHHEKKLKTDPSSCDLANDVVVIEDEEKEHCDGSVILQDTQKESDCNQNYIIKNEEKITCKENSTDQVGNEPNSGVADRQVSIIQVRPTSSLASPTKNLVKSVVVIDVTDNQNSQTPSTRTPIIEDISSDEETLVPSRFYGSYENKIASNPAKIVKESEITHCSLIDGNAKLVENAANRQFFEKPLVNTKLVTTEHIRRHSVDSNGASIGPGYLKEQPGDNAKEQGGLTKVKNTSKFTYSHLKNLNGRGIPSNPAYHVPMESLSPLSSPRFVEDRGYPRVSPINSPPNTRFSPNFKPPNKSLPAPPVIPVPVVVPRSPAVPASPLLKNSGVNWKTWFTDEQKKGFFNFVRSQSTDSEDLNRRQSIETISSAGSDYCSKFPGEDNYYEIKIDSKPYRIKRSLYEKIPKGKLCYIRETNTFIRYFDDNQMELFIRNLNIGEGSLIATDLLKQIKGRVEGFSDTDTSLGHYEASGKSEIITLSKDVNFSTEDYLSDPELYVEEVEKVQKFVPKDFYGFYKFVTGYQIVNHHPPISFQTFLTMHNTNGIKGLFKNYVNTLIEGRNTL